MKITARTAAVVLGVCILGCVIGVIGFTLLSRAGDEEANIASGAMQGSRPNAEDVLGESADDAAKDETIGNTKVKERPDAAELASKRLERRREELLETLEEYKRAGLGGSHPQVVKITEALSKIKTEEAAAGEKPSD